MCRSRIYGIILMVLFLAMPRFADAQSVAMSFSALPTDPAELAMGGISEVSDDTRMNASAGYMLYSPSYVPASYMTAQAEYVIKDKIGFSLGALYGKCAEYEMFNPGGLSSGYFTPAQMKFNAGVEYKVLNFLSAGIKLKYLGESLAPEAKYGAFAGDVYVTADVPLSSTSSLVGRAGVANAGTKVKSASGQGYSLPSSALVAAGYKSDFGRSRLSIMAQADYYFCNTLAISAGASYTFNDLVSLRAGYHVGDKVVMSSFASAGLGLCLFGARLDFAYLFGSDVMKNTLSVSVGYAF